MISGDPKNDVVHFVGPKFAAISVASVDIEGNSMDCVLCVAWSAMIKINLIGQSRCAFSRARWGDHFCPRERIARKGCSTGDVPRCRFHLCAWFRSIRG